MMRGFLPVFIIVAFLSNSARATEPPPEAGENDAWKGKRGEAVVSVLGQPTKTKRTSDGGQVLVYKVFRVDEDSRPGPELMLVELPGVGLVARPTAAFDPFQGETTSFEATGVDEKGRPLAGGVRTTRSSSISWDDEGNVIRSGAQELPALKKMKLTFRLDPKGTILDWSVSPKKR